MDEALTDSECIRHFEVTTGVEVVVNGDESRTRLARQVIEHQEMLSAQSVRLLEAFIA